MEENEEEVVCGRCATPYAEEDMVTIDDVLYCEDCTVVCEGDCGDRNLRQNMVRLVRPSWDRGVSFYCSDCVPTCNDCCGNYHPDAMREIGWDGATYCENCSQYCGRCGDYFIGESCCQVDIEEYHHTRPSMWLGGPVRARGGYYIGFENEIGTSRMVGTPVLAWGNANVAEGSFHCKEDSSVEGFEIVTEPMTPEFFENVDWDGFFTMLNAEYPLGQSQESSEHGLHVHIGRSAFDNDHPAIAAFAYLLATGSHLERVGRRSPTGYCNKVTAPVSVAMIASGRGGRQRARIRDKGIYGPGRDAINLTNGSTIEIRAFRATRSADELRNAVRFVYVAAEYIRSLRNDGTALSPKVVNWLSYTRWVAVNYPDAFASIAGVETTIPVATPKRITPPAAVNYEEREQAPRRVVNTGIRAGLAMVDAAVRQIEYDRALEERAQVRGRRREAERQYVRDQRGRFAAATDPYTYAEAFPRTFPEDENGRPFTIDDLIEQIEQVRPVSANPGERRTPDGRIYYVGCDCLLCRDARAIDANVDPF